MADRVELGVFLPIGNNGFMISKASPQYAPSFSHNKEIAVLAEQLEFDYVFTMSKWRGFGGETKFWDTTLESVTLMTAIAAVTSRIGMIATIQPVLFPPAVAAKMAATIDDISNGRFGINIVTGSYLDEYEQMGILPEGYAANRYRYAAEWLHVVKRLWSEESVTFDGDWFHLNDCRSSPKPVQKPHPFIICAGKSDEGFRFTAQEGNYSFISGGSIEQIKSFSRRMKETAIPYKRQIKTATTLLPIIANSRSAAETQLRSYQDGADVEAISNISSYFSGINRKNAADRVDRMKRDISYTGRIVAGTGDMVADVIEDLVRDGDLDSIQVLFPDYIEGLKAFGKEVMPILRERGLIPSSSGARRS